MQLQSRPSQMAISVLFCARNLNSSPSPQETRVKSFTAHFLKTSKQKRKKFLSSDWENVSSPGLKKLVFSFSIKALLFSVICQIFKIMLFNSESAKSSWPAFVQRLYKRPLTFCPRLRPPLKFRSAQQARK
jgi:hypothetical protein